MRNVARSDDSLCTPKSAKPGHTTDSRPGIVCKLPIHLIDPIGKRLEHPDGQPLRAGTANASFTSRNNNKHQPDTASLMVVCALQQAHKLRRRLKIPCACSSPKRQCPCPRCEPAPTVAGLAPPPGVHSTPLHLKGRRRRGLEQANSFSDAGANSK
jgi:hypothetical protein